MIPAPVAPPLSTGLALWRAIPQPVRRMLQARVPLDTREHGSGAESLVVAVGPGVPLRWLEVCGTPAGGLLCRLYEVRAKVKEVASAATTADGLTRVLQEWARLHGLSG